MFTALLTTLCLAGPATLPIRVEGEGYLRLAKNGRLNYATQVTLTSFKGAIGTTDGQTLLPRLSVEGEVTDLSVDLRGNITVKGKQVGRIVLAAFPGGKVTTGVVPDLVNPGEGVFGVIRAGEETPVAPKTTAGPEKKSTVPAGTTTLIVNAHPEVAGEQFTIGDISTIDGDAAVVEQIRVIGMGASPLPGTDRGLARVHILARLRMAGIDVTKVNVVVPEGATVTRKSQTIDSETLIDTARSTAQNRLGITANLVATKPPVPMTLPPGEVDLSAECGTMTQSGVTVTVTARVGNKVVGSRAMTLVLENPALGVKTGDTVRIRLVSHGATVECQGRATSSGVLGQNVNVTISIGASGTKTLTGVVKDAGIVEVSA